jgi:predicted dehydrogenase
MKMYYPNLFSREAYVEIPYPTVSSGQVLVDVSYAADVYGMIFQSSKPTNGPIILEIFKSNYVLYLKNFLKYSWNYSPCLAMRLGKNLHFRSLKKRYCSFLSVSGRICEVMDDSNGFQIGDYVAAIGFQQPSLSEFVVVSSGQVFKINPGSEEQLRLCALLFFGAAASFVLGNVIRMTDNLDREIQIIRIGDSTWIQMFFEMINYYSVHREELGSLPSEEITNAKISDVSRIVLVGNGNKEHYPKDDEIVFRFANWKEQEEDWNARNILLQVPDPWEKHNLSMFSVSKIDLPVWLHEKYLKLYLNFLSRNNDLDIDKTKVFFHNFGSISKNRERKIFLNKSLKSSQRIKVGVIGAGLFSNILLPRMMNHKRDISLLGIADRNPEKAWVAAKTFDFRYCTSDAHEILDSEEIDCVFILTDHISHTALAVDALQKNKYVYVEKPHVISFSQLELLMKNVEESNYKLQVGFNRRYSPDIIAAKKFLGNHDSPSNIMISVRSYDVPPNSFYYWPEQGTRIVSNCCHHLDLCYYLVGSKPVDIFSLSSIIGKRDDNVSISVAFEDGSLCTINFGNQGDNIIKGEEYVRILKGKKTVEIFNYSKIVLREQGRIIERSSHKVDFGHSNSLRLFFNNIQKNRLMGYQKNDVIYSALLFLYADESSRNREIVKLPTSGEDFVKQDVQ